MLLAVFVYHWYVKLPPVAVTLIVFELAFKQTALGAAGCAVNSTLNPSVKFEVFPDLANAVKVPFKLGVDVKFETVVIELFVPPGTPWLNV